MTHSRRLIVPASLLALALPAQRVSAAPAPRVHIQAAVEGAGNYAGKAYFFSGDYYVRYDWIKNRVDAGYPKPNRVWPLDPPFGNSPDAALEGKGKYVVKGYFFKDAQYVRYDWGWEKVDTGFPLGLDAWALRGAHGEKIDAALNGVGKYAGKAYFFRGGEYVRYDWAKETMDPGFPASNTAWDLSGPASNRIDAAINGSGPYAYKAYFFHGEQYTRYNWTTEKVDQAAAPIAGNWPGVVEMLQAGHGSGTALEWIRPTLTWLRAELARANAGTAWSASDPIVKALGTHFHVTAANRTTYLPAIIANFEAVEKVLNDPGKVYRFRDNAQAAADGGSRGGVPFPAYTFHATSINFTTQFTKFGPLCQAAMALHEAVHFVDKAATAANDFYEHGPEYATLTPAQAIHNPSSYASFAQHVYYGRDTRYGAARPDE